MKQINRASPKSEQRVKNVRIKNGLEMVDLVVRIE